MRTADLDRTIVFRASPLRFYAAAHSSIGARLRGGRFNRPGVSALYLALEADTALAEYWQTDPPRPVVLVPNELSAGSLLDLRARGKMSGSDWRDWQCDWKLAREAHDSGDVTADCASWRCGDDAIARKVSGIVYPSTRRTTGTNVVLFTDHIVAGTVTLTLLDPNGEIGAANPPVLVR